MNRINELIKELSRRKNSPTVTNPYLNRDNVDNLRCYLNFMCNMAGKRVLLVGEAPGYKGCNLTGIPFTSGQVFERFEHPLLDTIKNRLKLERIESENTATIVWDYLSRKKHAPLFWNAFPFHPHPPGKINNNRKPNAREIHEGVQYLLTICQIFQPELLAGIGEVGVEGAKIAFPELDIAYIRHPSFGGKADFIKGMDKLL